MLWNILLVILLMIVLILLCPIHVRLFYNGKLTVKVGVPFLKFRIYPDRAEDLLSDELSLKQKRKLKQKLMKKEARAMRRLAKDKKKRKKTSPRSPKESLKGRKGRGVVKDLGVLFRLIRILAAKFGKKLKIKIKRLEIVAASGDAATTAYLFGALSQTVAYGLAAADRYINIKFRNSHVWVRADFCAEKTSVDADILFCIRLCSLLRLACSVLWLFAKESLKDSFGELEAPSDNIENKKGISV